jgi:hypothetical protein
VSTGIVFVPPSFRTDEFAAIADALEQVARDYASGLGRSGDLSEALAAMITTATLRER